MSPGAFVVQILPASSPKAPLNRTGLTVAFEAILRVIVLHEHHSQDYRILPICIPVAYTWETSSGEPDRDAIRRLGCKKHWETRLRPGSGPMHLGQPTPISHGVSRERMSRWSSLTAAATRPCRRRHFFNATRPVPKVISVEMATTRYGAKCMAVTAPARQGPNVK